MTKRAVSDAEVIQILLDELKSLRAEINALKADTPKADSTPKTGATQPKKKKVLETIKQLEKELIELDAEYWTLVDKRSIVAGRLADLYSEIGEQREKSYYDFPTSRQVFAVSKLAPKANVPLLGMLYKGQLSQVIDLAKRKGDDAAKKKLTEFIEQLQVR